MKKLPVGIQTFAEMRDDNHVYVDKTGLAAKLAEQYKYVFLSRPRRFGKSLFLDTLKEMFEGNKRLFAGLAADHGYDWQTRYPVIVLSFAEGDFSTPANVQESIGSQIAINEKRLGLPEEQSIPALRLGSLIRNAKEKFASSVVVLVDEYDKPILDNIQHPSLAEQARNLLRGLYGGLKANAAHLRFVFLTGVSKFSKVSIFSGLNNLRDISLSPEYGAICGYTHDELQAQFSPYLDGVDMKAVRAWYDGYNFRGKNVYNPFDILLFLDNDKEFSSYWFETGTPNALVGMIREKRFFLPDLTRITAGEELLTSFDIENMNLITMLFQTGYLTIKEIRTLGHLRQYILDFPNLEVSAALNNSLLSIFKLEGHDTSALQMQGYAALLSGDLDGFHRAAEALFAAIPYHNFTGNEISRYEGFYASVLYAWLASFRVVVRVEDCTNKGRMDMSIELDNSVYILEFKVDDQGTALGQIRDRGYAKKYTGMGKQVFGLGISFSSTEKNISQFIWEKIA